MTPFAPSLKATSLLDAFQGFTDLQESEWEIPCLAQSAQAGRLWTPTLLPDSSH